MPPKGYERATVGGRYLERPGRLCHGCDIRLTIGTPRATESWPKSLTLTRDQVNYLLEAAAEYMLLTFSCENCQHPEHGPLCVHRDHDSGRVCRCSNYLVLGGEPDAVEFVDWMAVDALREAA